MGLHRCIAADQNPQNSEVEEKKCGIYLFNNEIDKDLYTQQMGN